jgi:hypothetical protein
MVPVMSLWLPIVLSAVFVFVVSFVIHMLLPYHRSDLGRLPKEDEVMAALRPFNVPPGDYVMPHAGSPEGMRKPEFLEKMTKGPVAFLTFAPAGPPSMTSNLVLWFLYAVLVSFFAAYITSHALGAGTDYLQVFRFIGASAFMGYSLAQLQDSIWYRRSWATTWKNVFDGLIYALFTAGTFGWLWPR